MKKILLFIVVSCLAYIAIAQTDLLSPKTEEQSQTQVEEKGFRESLNEQDEGRLQASEHLKASMLECLDKSTLSAETKATFSKEYAGTNLLFLAIGVISIVIAIIIRLILGTTISKISEKLEAKKKSFGFYLHDVIKPLNAFILLSAIYVLAYLNIANLMAMVVIFKILAIYALWICLSFILSLIRTFFKLFAGKVEKTKPSLFMLISLFRSIAISLAVIIFLLLVLENFGVNISAIIASLGIGGAALAFASQDTIANFFGSVAIIIDRPFIVGDEVIIANWHGFIEEIGLRSTKLRTFHSELISIPNSTLANAHIRNNSARTIRRVEFSVGLVYSTTKEQLQSAVEAIETALKNTENVEVVIVRFDEFADSSLNISIIYLCKITDYAEFMRIKELANYNVMDAVRNLGLSMAFPSRSLYIEKND